MIIILYLFIISNCFQNKYIFIKNKITDINKIPIAFTPDKKFILPTIVSITSLLKNKNINTYYIINIIFIQNFTNHDLNLFIQLGNIYDNWELNFIKIKNIFKNFPTCKNLPHSTYIRLIFSSLFKNYSKIIYLDGDTIILKDLLSMYNINIEQYYFVGQFHNGAKDEKFLKYSKHYINAGVLLINLLKQRQDEAEEKLLKWGEKNKKFLTFKDQTIINYCFIDKVGLLPPEYGILSNPFNFYIKRTKNFKLGKYNRTEYEKAYKNPIIVHFHGPRKPWMENSKKRYYRNYWWVYAKLSGIYDILLKRLKKKYLFGIIKYNNENNYNLENYLLYFGQIKLLLYYKNIKYVKIENIDNYNETKIKVIINKIINNKIPSKYIRPIFISFEINKNNYKKNVINYLKKNEPIGCNNIFTYNYLKKKNIKSFYSGSYLTLLAYKKIKKKKKKEFNNKIFLDFKINNLLFIYNDLIEIFKNYKNEEFIFIKNKFSDKLNEKEIFKITESLFNDFSLSKLVVTSNINIALICLGYKTPVILISNNDEENFDFYKNIFNIYGFYNNKLIKNFIFDKNHNIINKYLDIKILNNLEKTFKYLIKI